MLFAAGARRPSIGHGFDSARLCGRRRGGGIGSRRRRSLLRRGIGSGRLYGLITQFIISPDHRDEFIHLLSRPAADLPGCLSYVIAKDAARQDAVWITEVWADKESHARSLKRPEVLEAIGKGRPLVTGMGVRVETEPVAGRIISAGRPRQLRAAQGVCASLAGTGSATSARNSGAFSGSAPPRMSFT